MLARAVLRARYVALSLATVRGFSARPSGLRIQCVQWSYATPHSSRTVLISPCRRNWSANRLFYPSRARTGSFLTDTVPAFFIPPMVFIGLLLTLWTYKCIMMVIFQDKIIYMPSVPPFSRSEKIIEYARACGTVRWEEKHIKSLDRTDLALCIGSLQALGDEMLERKQRRMVILYFQGNASSLPPRLPMLSKVLHAIQREEEAARCTLVALSYRGYWKSRGRATQRGIELDAQALLTWASSTYPNAELVLWGQSIGAGVATTAAARSLKAVHTSSKSRIAGLVLETPFVSVQHMLAALYPQKWLPYRYLHPFLWNHWDSEKALRTIAEAERRPKILLVPAAKDEIVTPGQADYLERLCKGLGFNVQRLDVSGALHTEAMAKGEGRKAVVEFVRVIGEG